jgi:hypothetical protein
VAGRSRSIYTLASRSSDRWCRGTPGPRGARGTGSPGSSSSAGWR